MAKYWLREARERMEKKGTVGAFSKAAHRAGMATMAYARKMMKHKHVSTMMKSRAQFTINAAKARR